MTPTVVAARAVMTRELRVQYRYPVSMINLVLLTPLYEMVIPTLLLGAAFLVNGSATGLARSVGTDDLVGWVSVGLLVATLMVGAVRGVAGPLESDRSTGVLEHNWSVPVSREVFVMGGVAAGTVFTAVASMLLVAFGVVALGASFSPHGVLLALPVVVLLLVGNCGFGYLAAALALTMRRPDDLLGPVTPLVAAFSGVAFPLTVLPEAVRWVTYLLPGTMPLDLMRHVTLGTDTLLPPGVELAVAMVTAAGWLLLGRRLFLRAERRVQGTGALNQF
ncbi:ABC transporter permease [Streptomyces sp. NPDC058665]|uniref:ABC transporter permease n=1 Tax=Streptomyces sp. NPDC058665 TaxID=3346586 RepID=UPI0036668DDC